MLHIMEEFKELLNSHIAQRQRAKKTDDRVAVEALRKGLHLTREVLCEIEAKHTVKCRDYESVDNLLCDLQSYRSCSIENSRRNILYITAELSAFILMKLINSQEMNEKISGIKGSEDKKLFDTCNCGSLQYIEKLDGLIEILLDLKSVDRIKVSCFVSSIIDLKLPVAVLNALHKAELLSVSVYVMHIVDSKNMLDFFIEDLIDHLGRNQSKNDENSLPVLCEASVRLLAVLLQMALGDEIAEPEPALLRLCNETCHDVLDQLIIQISARVLSEEEYALSGKHFLQLCETKWHLGGPLLQKFFLLSLQSLSTGVDIASERALALQERWSHIEVRPLRRLFVQNLLEAMGQEAAFSGISSMIREEPCKWQSVLGFINVYLTHLNGAAAPLKAFVDEILNRALTRHSRSLLACVFLLARQASMYASVVNSVFSSYGAWFGSTFGVEAGPLMQTASNPVAFTFLMTFLTDLVPTDPPLCLRVHINKVPTAPTQCSHLLTDYTSLAKTRLQDLGETTGSGLFAFENTPKEDVAAALAYFERSRGQVSRVLLDSSVFRRVQFERQFLPALLVPEPIYGERTSRQQLINKLQAAGKISLSMLQQYEVACQRLTLQHSGPCKTGALSGNPLEGWQRVLEMLVDTVRNDGMNEAGGLTEQTKAAVSSVASHLETLLHQVAERPDSATMHRKIIGRLFKACERTFEPPTPLGIVKSLAWPQSVLTLLISQPALLRQFRGAVYQIACNTTLPNHVTQTAAAFACTMDLQEDEINLKSSFENDSSCSENKTLGESIGQNLQLTCQKSMLHALSFCSLYLQLFNDVQTGGTPSPWKMPMSLLRILIYLCERLVHSSSNEILDACAQAWSPVSSWTIAVTEAQLSFPEWLDLEAAIDPSDDPVQERHLYMCGWIMKHCDPPPVAELLAASIAYTRKGHIAWGKEVLQTIPSLVMPSDAVPWLLEAWMEISARFSYQEIFKAVQSLPPWMLLTNTPNVSPTPKAICALAHLISQQKEKMSEGNFLSLRVVCMVIGAVRAADLHNPGQLLSHIVDASPALHLGILRHGRQIQLQLSSTFKTSFPLGSNIMRLVNAITNEESEQTFHTYSWEVGLLHWSQGVLLYDVDDGSLFFHLLSLGRKLLSGEVSLAIVSHGPVLPSALKMASLLVQEPLQCLKLLRDAVVLEPHNLPGVGLSKRARTGLALATMSAFLSLSDDQLPCSGEVTARMCSQVVSQCLSLWKEECLELDPCSSGVREITFVRFLTIRIQRLLGMLDVGRNSTK